MGLYKSDCVAIQAPFFAAAPGPRLQFAAVGHAAAPLGNPGRLSAHADPSEITHARGKYGAQSSGFPAGPLLRREDWLRRWEVEWNEWAYRDGRRLCKAATHERPEA